MSIPTESYIGFLDKLSENYREIVKKFECLFDSYIDSIATLFSTKNSQMRELQATKLKNLEMEKKNIEIENSNILANLLKMRIMIEGADLIAQQTVRIGQNRILEIDKEIKSLQSEDEFEIFCKRIPTLLKKTFELSEKVLFKDEYEEIREDLYDLVNTTSFELKIGKNKALKIGLY